MVSKGPGGEGRAWCQRPHDWTSGWRWAWTCASPCTGLEAILWAGSGCPWDSLFCILFGSTLKLFFVLAFLVEISYRIWFSQSHLGKDVLSLGRCRLMVTWAAKENFQDAIWGFWGTVRKLMSLLELRTHKGHLNIWGWGKRAALTSLEIFCFVLVTLWKCSDKCTCWDSCQASMKNQAEFASIPGSKPKERQTDLTRYHGKCHSLFS